MHSIDDRRLNELNRQVQSLQQRQAEQQSTAEQLWRELEQAREHDLDAEAKALHTGAARKPKPKAPEVERALENATHDLEILGRALAMAQMDLSQYLSQHHQDLGRKLQEARAERAREVSELAAPLLEALRSFYAIADDAEILAPYTRAAAPENTGEPESTVVVLGPITRQNVLGPDRIGGLARVQLEGVVTALVDLPASEATDGETIVGATPSEAETETEAETSEATDTVVDSARSTEATTTTTLVGPSEASGDPEADEEDVARILGPPPELR